MSRPYRIPADCYRCEITIINSRFITSIAPAPTVDAARQAIAAVRAALPDASHHVYAFRVGYGSSVTEGMSDDGEPSGTAGPPTLAVLRGSDIGDIALVTTRYFGGTKLGTGGLVRAYTEAAQTALATLPTALKTRQAYLGLDLPYGRYEAIKRLIAQFNGLITEERFAGEVTLFVTLLAQQAPAFQAQLIQLTAGQVQAIVLDER